MNCPYCNILITANGHSCNWSQAQGQLSQAAQSQLGQLGVLQAQSQGLGALPWTPLPGQGQFVNKRSVAEEYFFNLIDDRTDTKIIELFFIDKNQFVLTIGEFYDLCKRFRPSIDEKLVKRVLKQKAFL